MSELFRVGLVGSARRALGAAAVGWWVTVVGSADLRGAEAIRVPGDAATIQEALDLAADGDTVLVAPGEYAIDQPLDFNRLADPDAPGGSPVKDLALVSEAGATATVVRMSREPRGEARASVIVFEHEETSRSTVEGFTLAGGLGTGGSDGEGGLYVRGGGALVGAGSAPVFRRCVFTQGNLQGRASPNGMWRWGDGAGAYCGPSSSPRFEGCRFIANRAGSGGGVLVDQESVVGFDDCVFVDNLAGWGSAIAARRAELNVRRVTMNGNRGAAIAADGVTASVLDSIVWDNEGGSTQSDALSSFLIRNSLVEGVEPDEAAGVVGGSPRFCGWSPHAVAFADAAAAPGGDGSEERPYVELSEALDYSLALASDSPCRGTASDGGDMGASEGRCETLRGDEREIRLAAGEYELAERTLYRGVSLVGAGAEQTLLRGSVSGLRDGAKIAELTVEAPGAIGISVVGDPAVTESVSIVNCTVRASEVGLEARNIDAEVQGCRFLRNGVGVRVYDFSEATLDDCVIALNNWAAFEGAATTTRLDHCTIVRNGSGVHWWRGDLTVSSSIITQNLHIAFELPEEENDEWSATVTRSLHDSERSWSGNSNLRGDPLFCGWPDVDTIHVDPSAEPGGDGSEVAPLRDARSALAAHSFSLAPESPCRGTGADGSDMGAPLSACDDAPRSTVEIRLAAGRHDLGNVVLSPGAGFAGEGPGRTELVGQLTGLDSGGGLADLTVTGPSAVSIAPGGSPRIERCEFNAVIATWGTVLQCGRDSSPIVEDCTFSRTRRPEALYSWGNLGERWVVGCEEGSAPVFQRCRFENNEASILNSHRASPQVESCIIRGNLGAVFHVSAGSLLARDCLITENMGSNTMFDLNGEERIEFTRCTISRNSSTEGAVFWLSRHRKGANFESTIVWGNSEPLFGDVESRQQLKATYSLVQGETRYPGTGNILEDPGFCGWRGDAEVFVDAAASPGGDGSAARPFAMLESALEYRQALADGSPCRGTGNDGSDMGAPADLLGTAEECGSGSERRTIRLATGSYDASGRWALGVEMAGSGRDATTVTGPIVLAGESSLEQLSVVGPGPGVLIASAALATLTECDVSNTSNVAVLCGSASDVSFEQCRIEDNRGAGVFCRSTGRTEFIDGEISGNEFCGFFADWGRQVEIRRSVFARNGGYWDHGSRVGCALRLNGEAGILVDSCRFVGNLNPAISGDGTARLVNTEVVGSYSDASSWPQPAIRPWGGSFSFLNCTVADNSHAGIGSWGAAVTLENSIVWGNSAGPLQVEEEAKPLFTATFTAMDLDPAEAWPELKILATPPDFVAPGRFVAGEWIDGDYRLSADSALIDAGDAELAPEHDLLGNARPCGGGVDIGAYEYCRGEFVRGDANADGAVQISDPIAVLDHLFGGAAAPACEKAADANDSGTIDISDPIAVLNHLFAGAAPLPGPYPTCGTDPTEDGLSCRRSTLCEP